jgi:hypothetical protein
MFSAVLIVQGRNSNDLPRELEEVLPEEIKPVKNRNMVSYAERNRSQKMSEKQVRTCNEDRKRTFKVVIEVGPKAVRRSSLGVGYRMRRSPDIQRTGRFNATSIVWTVA